jgi:hypothetical protein
MNEGCVDIKKAFDLGMDLQKVFGGIDTEIIRDIKKKCNL